MFSGGINETSLKFLEAFLQPAPIEPVRLMELQFMQ